MDQLLQLCLGEGTHDAQQGTQQQQACQVIVFSTPMSYTCVASQFALSPSSTTSATATTTAAVATQSTIIVCAAETKRFESARSALSSTPEL